MAEEGLKDAGVADFSPDALPRDEEARRRAITEILAELKADDEPPAPPPAEPPQAPIAGNGLPLSQPPEESLQGPHGGEQDEAPQSVAGPHEGGPTEPPEPLLRQATPLVATSGPLVAQAASGPLAATFRTLILLHALLLLAVVVGTWLMYGRVSATLGQIAARPAPPAASPSLPQPPAAAAAKPSLGEPVLQVDEGLRYVQEMEKADLLFEKGQHYAAAAGYRRALDILPESWNDGAAAFRLGECYLKLADCPNAIAAYERVALAPRSDYYPQALLQIGETHLKLKAYARAREAFYSLLLLQGRFGAEAAPCVERAYYRVADTYWLEAQGLAEAKRGTGR